MAHPSLEEHRPSWYTTFLSKIRTISVFVEENHG